MPCPALSCWTSCGFWPPAGCSPDCSHAVGCQPFGTRGSDHEMPDCQPSFASEQEQVPKSARTPVRPPCLGATLSSMHAAYCRASSQDTEAAAALQFQGYSGSHDGQVGPWPLSITDGTHSPHAFLLYCPVSPYGAAWHSTTLAPSSILAQWVHHRHRSSTRPAQNMRPWDDRRSLTGTTAANNSQVQLLWLLS